MEELSSNPGDFRGIRYRTVSAVTAMSGQLWSLPTRGYFIEAYAHTQETAVWVYDHSRPTAANLITLLVATPGAKSEPFPPVKGVTIPIERGVWVSFSSPTNGGISLGYSP